MANLKIRERVLKFFGGLTLGQSRMKEEKAYASGYQDGNDEPALNMPDGSKMALGYRTAHQQRRDLSDWSQEKAIEAAYRLWNTNPLAGALTELLVDYVIGDVIIVNSQDEKIQEALDHFLSDPVNDLIDRDGGVRRGIENFTRELGLFGEQLVLLFPRTGEDVGMVADGLVRIGTIDPSRIHSIIVNPKNNRELWGVRLKSTESGGVEDGPVYRVVQEKVENGRRTFEGQTDFKAYADSVNHPERLTEKKSYRIEGESLAECVKRKIPLLVEEGYEQKQAVAMAYSMCEEGKKEFQGKELIISSKDGTLHIKEAENGNENFTSEGDCFFFQINKISTGTRGRPDLLRMIDWLDRFDQLFFDGAEHAALLNMFVWDVEVTGGSENDPSPERNLKVQAKKVAGMRPGSNFTHNQNVKLTAVNPSLQTADLEVLVRNLRILVAGGARIPEHWLGEGSRANRATAEVMGQPTYKMLIRRQALIRDMIQMMCQYQIDVLVGLGNLKAEVKLEGEKKAVPARDAFTITMPDINVEDISMSASAFGSVASAIGVLISGQILPKEEGLEILAAVASLLGVEFKVEEILSKLETEIAETAEQQQVLANNIAKIEAAEKKAGANGGKAMGTPKKENS